MFLHGGAPALGRQVGLIAGALDPVRQQLVRLDQRVVARGPENGLVDILVDAEIGRPVGSLVGLPKVFGHGSDPRQLFVAGHLRGEFACQSFERRQNVEHLASLTIALPGDDGTAMRDQIQQSFGRKHLERLAQRRARNLKLVGQGLFIDLFTRLQLALQDHLTQPVGDFDGQRRASDGIWLQLAHAGLLQVLMHGRSFLVTHFGTLCRKLPRYARRAGPCHPRSGGGRRCH